MHSMKVLESSDLLCSLLHRICAIILLHGNALACFTNCGFSPSWQSWFLLPLITTCSFSAGLMLDTVWTSEHACAVYPGQHLFPFSLFYILLTKVMYPFIFPLQLCESDCKISVILIKSQSDDVLRFLVYFFYSPNLLHDIDAGDAYLIDISSLCFAFFSPLANYFLYGSLPLWRSQPSYCCVYLTVRFFHFPVLFLVKTPSSRLAS